MIKSPLILKDIPSHCVIHFIFISFIQSKPCKSPIVVLVIFSTVFFWMVATKVRRNLPWNNPQRFPSPHWLNWPWNRCSKMIGMPQHGKMLAASQAKSCIPWRWFIMWITVDLPIIKNKKTVLKWNTHGKLQWDASVRDLSHKKPPKGKYWAERPCQAWTESIGCRVWETLQPWLAHGWLNLPSDLPGTTQK